MTSRLLPIFLLPLLIVPACTMNYTVDLDTIAADTPYFEDKAVRVSDLLVFGPQPEKTDLPSLQQNGVQKVISFRTPEEIEDMDYEQASSLQNLGIEFSNIPIGGDDFPYSPAAYHSLVDELSSVDPKNGPVLLHCKSGWRASVIGVAYLVKHEGMELNEALEYAEGWWPLSLEKVLDTEFVLQQKP